MNDFSESGAAVRFVTAWCVDLEGKRNFDARGVEIVTCAAVGAEIHACMAGVVMTWLVDKTRGDLRSPRGHRVRQWAKSKMHRYCNQGEKCKVAVFANTPAQ